MIFVQFYDRLLGYIAPLLGPFTGVLIQGFELHSISPSSTIAYLRPDGRWHLSGDSAHVYSSVAIFEPQPAQTVQQEKQGVA